ncbi:MAG: hypothetical protein JWQ74_62 [Marmoricola sp.]|nr:hypothetical protein [Marmoricola sp.]
MVGLIAVLVRTPSKPAEPLSLGPVLPSATASARPALPEVTPTPSPTSLSSADALKAYQDQLKALGSGGSASSGEFGIPGIQGGSVYNSASKHRIDLRVTSEEPIGTVGYVVPTSLKKSRGVAKNVGRSWSLTTYGYGDPKYAELFLQAGARGFPITCVIKIDGKVTERRSTDGPYGALICVG